MQKSMIAGLCLSAVAAFVPATAVAGPAVTTQWDDTSMSQEECLRRAEAAISKAGFRDLERVGQSRFGTLRDYTVSIRCVTSKQIIFFLVSGPNRNRTSSYIDRVHNNF